jgi:formamidopyrimidine-DNA glycosylase
MPELPEVETIRAGIISSATKAPIVDVLVHSAKLRFPIPQDLPVKLKRQVFTHIERRGKYLFLHTAKGVLLVHFGMSGQFRILPKDFPKFKHEHLTIVFADGMSLRFIDPRKFGAILWAEGNPHDHPQIAYLGYEPLSDEFNAKYFFDLTRRRKGAIKQVLMDGKVVVGVGNIYANEALFLAGIKPWRPACSLSFAECRKLVAKVKGVLREAIALGGTTIKDFANSEGKGGYFQQQLKVYGRGGKGCMVCGKTLQERRLGQRSTVYCPKCQK